MYGPQGDDEMILFLQGLTGDFNLIYKASDKNNSNFNWVMMDLFRRVIDDLTLKEIPLHGCRYTSSNQQDHPVLVKLYSLLLGGLGVVFFFLMCFSKVLPLAIQIIVPWCWVFVITILAKDAFISRRSGLN